MEEITGRMKWFDANKGFGFIDAGGTDYLLHTTAMKSADRRDPPQEGATILFEAKETSKGMQVATVISIDRSTEIEKPCFVSSTHHKKVPEDIGGFEIAFVKWFNNEKGFGFLSRGEGTPDIFLHKEVLRHSRVNVPQANDAMIVRFGKCPTGLVAAEVRSLKITDIQNAAPVVREAAR